jgi:hypothetical protein
MNVITLIGASHAYQYPGNPDADAFEAFIRAIMHSQHFAAIVEEMSLEALSEHGAPLSICKRVADERGTRHCYCDPDRDTRSRNDIRQENEIRVSAHFKGSSEREIREKIRASHDRREQYWLDRIIELDRWPVLFICGADHIGSFCVKVRALGIVANVFISDWVPTADGN